MVARPLRTASPRGRTVKHVTPPVAVDLLAAAIERVRAALDQTMPLPRRVRIFWAGVVASRNLGASDMIADDFLALAKGCGLHDELGAETINHLIRWGLLDRNPFMGKRHD
jgi:hypothetical protein